MKLSEILKEYRNNNNLTQTDLASKLFVSKQAISKWENDKGYPDLSLYPVLAEITGLSIDELMGIERKGKVVNNQGFENQGSDNKKVGFNKLKITSFVMLFIALIILIIMSIITINKDKKNIIDDNIVLNVLIENVYNDTGISITNTVTNWSYIDYSKWGVYDNTMPNNISFIVLDKPINTSKGNWIDLIDKDVINNILNIIPDNAHNFVNNSDSFILVNRTTKKLNEINLNKLNELDDLCLICYQKDYMRIIIINFYYVIK